MPKPALIRRWKKCWLILRIKEDELTIGLDADHALSIKRAPCSIACFCLAEITAAHDVGLRSRRAGAFDFLPVAGVKLDGTKAAVKLDESNGNDAAASVVDELFNESGFVHEEEVEEASLPMREEYHGWHEKGALRPRCHIS